MSFCSSIVVKIKEGNFKEEEKENEEGEGTFKIAPFYVLDTQFANDNARC